MTERARESMAERGGKREGRESMAQREGWEEEREGKKETVWYKEGSV